MTRSEMLNQLGLTDEELSSLLLKFRVFYGSLTASERAVIDRLLPHFKRAAGLFGGDITRDEMKTLLAPPAPAPGAPTPVAGAPTPVAGAPTPIAAGPAPVAGVAGAFGQNGINQITNPGDGGGDDGTP